MTYRCAVLAASMLLGGVMIPGVALAQDELNGASDRDHGRDWHPDGRGNRTRATSPRGRNNASGAVVTGNGISYHGGPVMQGTVNIYFIWYGDWKQDTKANAILSAWANNIGGSAYEDVNTTYGDTTGNVSGKASYAGSVSDTGSLGTSLSDSDIATLVSRALGTGLPIDSNGVYFVLTAPGVKETSGFLTQYCGWHSTGTLNNGTYIKYAFVGDAAASLGSCAWQTANSPNGDPAADAMISVMSHELEESISDPNGNAWYDGSGDENADKCAWTFGTTYPAGGGGVANMNIHGTDYLIQQNWVNAKGGYCALSYSATPDFSLSVSPTSQTLPSTGGTASYNLLETALNGFGGNVAYSQSGLTASWVSIAGTVLTARVPPGTSAGTYPFTITGTSGSLVQSIPASLVVSQPQPSFTIGISPGSSSVTAGGKVTYTVTIAPVNGFTGRVSLNTSGASGGVHLSLNPNSITTGGTSILTVTTDTSARKGTLTLTVTGKSGISKSASAFLQIN